MLTLLLLFLAETPNSPMSDSTSFRTHSVEVAPGAAKVSVPNAAVLAHKPKSEGAAALAAAAPAPAVVAGGAGHVDGF